MTRPSLTVVPDTPPPDLTATEAQAEFAEHWQAARKAHANLLTALGSVSYPLVVAQGTIAHHRLVAATHAAEAVARHASEIARRVTAAQEIFERVKP